MAQLAACRHALQSIFWLGKTMGMYDVLRQFGSAIPVRAGTDRKAGRLPGNI
jgi:hypothetical protein